MSLSVNFAKALAVPSIGKKSLFVAASVVIALAAGVFFWHSRRTHPTAGRVRDEARIADRSSFAEPDDDYFGAMDGGIDLALEETKGRNMWMIWSAGNDRFWDWLAHYTAGEFDLLKIVSSYDPDKDDRIPEADRVRLRQLYPFRRQNRSETLGVTNEPCFDPPPAPSLSRYGLWLDIHQTNCAGDPWESDQKYPGVSAGVRGRTIPLGSPYGAPSGIVGLRLFPNPDFNEAAARRWDAGRYYTDPAYYNSKDLVRPYRVGVTCAFCHAGLNPGKPPQDPNAPEWENLSSTAGAQFLRLGRVAQWAGTGSGFAREMLGAARAGTVDSTLILTDYMFNPRAIHPIYEMPARMRVARQWGRETLSGPALGNRQMSSYVAGGPLAAFFEEPATVWTPRLGWAAMDSVGILGGINRKFSDMAMFSEEWLFHFAPLIGGKPQVPVDMKVGRENSSYWHVTEEMTPDIVRFLMRMKAPAHPAAPAGDRTALARGKAVFADRCASCHSSKFPQAGRDDDPGACSGDYLDCWNRYRTWTKTPEYKQQILKIVQADDFLQDNYLSNDLRVPLPVVGSNACIALSSNGAAGRIWEQFTSKTYRTLPSAGSITYYHPVTGEERSLKLPAGGPGYLRPPSLVALWSTAPYLANNSVGRSDGKQGLVSRMAAFQESMEELLWPERREKDAVLGAHVPGKIDRTASRTTLRLPARVLPEELIGLLDPPLKFLPHFSVREFMEIGPIPEGTPIGLIANLNLLEPRAVELLVRMKEELKSEADFAKFVGPLLELSACPDLVVNRGHYFGTGLDGEPALSDQQKRDLIEFLRTM
jgi:cytochrome c5